MIVWHDRRKDGLLFAAGALAGATTCFLQQKGLLLLLALLVWLWIQRRRRSTSLSSLGAVAAGYISVVAFMLVYFWSQHALWDLFYANVVWPSEHYSAANVVPYAQGMIRGCWDHFVIAKSGFRWTIVTASVLITPFLFVAALPALLPALAARYMRNARQAGDCTLLAVRMGVVAIGDSPQGYLPSGIRIAAADHPVHLLSRAIPGEGRGFSLAGSCHKRRLSGWLQSFPGPRPRVP